ncbi:unnamed protein product [Enterobius vermicularis]|uniref:BTB domain-containing protein n=1 Tax=Enterobius vermicularis TaxID=51028 RepID=A0A0N4VKP7_ENTVE|nr:unnamed protein product [Enterobius vermicularis]
MTDIINDPINLCSNNISTTIIHNNSLTPNNTAVSNGDVCVKILTLDATNGSKHEDWILAHRIVLEASSSYLRNLVQASVCNKNFLATLPVIEINFGFLNNAAQAFRVILNFLYTGKINLESVDALEFTFFNYSRCFFIFLLNLSFFFAYLLFDILVASGSFLSLFFVIGSIFSGWCRNKKYIERVPNGFMCTVCRKIYGRYNSVSYHVTIYHRNPPIKCDEEGCQFTTREARYIHFHKYYRHHIALPDSIDLGSRKCPFCRHVSKSPAMLEKHISRHMPNCSRVGRAYSTCQQYPTDMNPQLKLHEHISAHQPDVFQCSECSYRFENVNLNSTIIN